MKTWKRGRKPATPEQKAKAKEWQTMRVKIANLVARNDEIEKVCCICGKPGNILHNRQDPYYISFICDECRKDPENKIIAEESRFDIRDKLSKSRTNVSNFTDQEVKRLIIGYMNSLKTIGEYCEEEGITRFQFSQLIKRYQTFFPNQPIEQMVANHSKKIKGELLKQMVAKRTL